MGFDGIFMTKDNQIVVRKANSLIEALFDANTQQKRLIVMAAAQVRRGDEVGRTYSFSLHELKKLARIKNESFYSEMEEVIHTITSIKIDICTNPNLVGEEVRWFSYKGYDPKTKIVTFRMDKYVQEIMLDVQEAFTTYLATNALALNKGTYISLYELLKSYEYKAKNGKFYREFEINHLAKVLGVNTETYSKFYDLKRFFFEPAIKAINNCTDIKISNVEYIKTGRSYTDVIFHCEKSGQTTIAIENLSTDDVATREPTAPTKPEEQKIDLSIMDRLITAGISINTAKKWLDKFGDKRIKQNLAYSLAKQKEGKVKTNFVGYLAKAIEGNWGEGFEDVTKKTLDPQRKAELEAYKKEQEAEAKREKDIEEKARIFALFEAQSESLQDVILDAVEDKVESAVNAPLFIKAIKDERKKGKIKSLLMKTSTQFMEAMRENGLID